jgi:hypothetical protein
VVEAEESHLLSVATIASDVASRADGRLDIHRWYDLHPATFTGSFEDAAAECRRPTSSPLR